MAACRTAISPAERDAVSQRAERRRVVRVPAARRPTPSPHYSDFEIAHADKQADAAGQRHL